MRVPRSRRRAWEDASSNLAGFNIFACVISLDSDSALSGVSLRYAVHSRGKIEPHSSMFEHFRRHTIRYCCELRSRAEYRSLLDVPLVFCVPSMDECSIARYREVKSAPFRQRTSSTKLLQRVWLEELFPVLGVTRDTTSSHSSRTQYSD